MSTKNCTTLAIQVILSKDSDQTVRMRRLIWIFAGHTPPKVCFFHTIDVRLMSSPKCISRVGFCLQPSEQAHNVETKFIQCWFNVDVVAATFYIGIKHGFWCMNIRQVPWEVFKTETKGRGFQHLPRDLANVNALKNHVWSLLLHKNWHHLQHSTLFLALFCFAFHRYLPNVFSTDYALSSAGQYTSCSGSKSVAPIRSYWKLRSRALTAHELPC